MIRSTAAYTQQNCISLSQLLGPGWGRTSTLLLLALSCQDGLFTLVTQNDFSSANQYIPIPGSGRKKVCPFLLRTLSRTNTHHLCLHLTGQNFLSHVATAS